MFAGGGIWYSVYGTRCIVGAWSWVLVCWWPGFAGRWSQLHYTSNVSWAAYNLADICCYINSIMVHDLHNHAP